MNYEEKLARREALRRIAAMAAAAALPAPLLGCRAPGEEAEVAGRADEPTAAAELPVAGSEDERRLYAGIETLRAEGWRDPARDLGAAAARVGELAIGTPYEGFTLEQYIHAGGSPSRTEPLTLSLTRFDCVSLVESCLAIARIARGGGAATWEEFAAEMERMRYRGGQRGGYATRLHYFSEWLLDNERRGLVEILGPQLGATADERPLRFMSSNPDSYPALAYPEVREEIASMERSLDGTPRWVVPTARIPQVSDGIRTGDILAFATSIRGLDVTHSAFAYRDDGGVLRVLHAPLSGGVVEITRTTLPQYVAAIRQSTGIVVARPLQG
jgi:hypothetical protein